MYVCMYQKFVWPRGLWAGYAPVIYSYDLTFLPRFIANDIRFLFSTSAWTSKGKSVDTTGKGALTLVKVPNLKVIRLKRAKI